MSGLLPKIADNRMLLPRSDTGVSVAELLAGDVRANANRAGNMLRSVSYVCPIYGSVVHAMRGGLLRLLQ